MVYKNLIPGQYQIGNLVMGTGTTVIVTKFDAQAYDINVQDYQVGMADETRFGQDQIKPTTISMEMSVLYNELLDNYKKTNPNFWSEQPRIEDLASEWRADKIRKAPGEMLPLYLCGKSGEERIIFGRPGQFSASKLSTKLQGQSIDCVAEFRRADIYNYSVQEYVVELTRNDEPTFILRSRGDAPSWLRIYAEGPLTNPIFTIGSNEIHISHTLKEGEALEISSYPWQRRVIDSNRINLAASTTGTAAYLDRVQLPPYSVIPVRWSSDEFQTWVPDLGNESWDEDIYDMNFLKLPKLYRTITGHVIVGIDIAHLRRKYLSSKFLLGNSSSCIYVKKKFNTSNQYVEVRLANYIAHGSSSIVIRSDNTLTNYAALEVVTRGARERYLKIRSGNSPSTNGVEQATWTNPDKWKYEDVIAFKSLKDDATGVTTYIGYINKKEVLRWVDTGKIVQEGRAQGFLFDTDGTIFTQGCGFRDIICYDTSATLAKTGKVHLMWRDTWGSIP